MKKSTTAKTNALGFTLIELAIVMSIIALLLGGMLMPLSSRLETQAYSDTQAKMNKITDALIGFAVLNNRLPCPSNQAGLNQGLEDAAPSFAGTGGPMDMCGGAASITSDAASNPTNSSWGSVPWQTLGLAETDILDAWNNRIRYSVRTLLTNTNGSPLNSINLLTAPNSGLIVQQANGGTNLTTTAAFVLVSNGKNAYGAIAYQNDPTLLASYRGFPTDPAATPNIDEFANIPRRERLVAGSTADQRRTFVSRIRTDATVSATEFDDIVTWVSSPTLTTKLIAGGRWAP